MTPACSVTASRAKVIQAYLDDNKLKFSLLASKVNQANERYSTQYNQAINLLGWTIAEKLACGSAPFNVTLVSRHSFIKHESSTKALFISADEKTEEGSLSDAYLELKLSSNNTFRLPIEVEFRSCELNSLAFKQRQLAISYKIGSGQQQVQIPELKQVPDCGLKFSEMLIKNVKSTLATEQLLTAVSFDGAALSLVIETDDSSFASKSASFDLVV